MAISPLQTARTFLRPLTLDDAHNLFELDSNAAVMRYVTKPAQSLTDSERYLTDVLDNQYAQQGFGRMAVIEKASGAFIGLCGLKYLPELDDADIGYRFLPSHWGQGFAFECAQAALNSGFIELGLKRIIGLASPANQASIRVLQKLGMTYEKNVLYWGEECQRYAISASAFRDVAPPPAR